MRGRVICLLALFLALAGCEWSNVLDAKPTTGRLPQAAEIPLPEETVRGESDPPVITLPLGTRLRERKLAKTEDLPSAIVVPTTNLNAVPVTAALQAVLTGTDVSLSWNAANFDGKLVSVTNLSGALPKVVEKICQSAKVFCGYRGGLLELKEKETFVVELPSSPTKGTASATNTMAETIKTLVGESVRVDQQGGNLLYTATVEEHERVQEYLEQLRHGRPLIVMQLYIWEVVLNKDNATGINWESFSVGKFSSLGQKFALAGATSFSSLTSPGVSLGATQTGVVDAETVLKFLSTKGLVQTISNPQITFVSGSSAEFRVGGERRYISQVGELTGSNVSGTSTGSSGLGTNTVSTDSIQTGLTVTLNGAFESGVISAYLQLELQDLVSLNSTETQGMTIDLPETSERKVETTLRVRPGDNLVLAGLVSSRDENDREGVPTFFGMVPTYASDTLKNTELVLFVKPSVVLFADKAEKAEPAAIAKKDAPLPDALVIDKDGVQSVKIPSVPVASAPKQDPAPAVAAAVYESSLEEKAPVDGALMQRGFSKAFDDLLAPSTDDGKGRP